MLSIKALECNSLLPQHAPCVLLYPPQLYPLNMLISMAIATMQNSVLQKSVLDNLTKSNFDPLLVLHEEVREYLKANSMAGHPQSCYNRNKLPLLLYSLVT